MYSKNMQILKASIAAISLIILTETTSIKAQAKSSERYQTSSCGSIVDQRSGLQWYVGPDITVTWNAADRWVGRLAACGGGWRLPTVTQLETLFDPHVVAGTGYFAHGKHWPAHIDPIFSGIGQGSWVWAEGPAGANAPAVNFNQGGAVQLSATPSYPVRVFAVKPAPEQQNVEVPVVGHRQTPDPPQVDQSQLPAGTQINVLYCNPGSRFDGYGTDFTIRIPADALREFLSSQFIMSTLNNGMHQVMDYCKRDPRNKPLEESSRFFAHIAISQSDVVFATKALGERWIIGQNQVAEALQHQQQQAELEMAQRVAQLKAEQDARRDEEYAAKLRAELTASVPPVPKELADLTEDVACRLAMAYLANMTPALYTNNYCPGGHSRHFSGCTGFLSNIAQGWATISVPFTYHGCYANESESGDSNYRFQHFDQGWKMIFQGN